MISNCKYYLTLIIFCTYHDYSSLALTFDTKSNKVILLNTCKKWLKNNVLSIKSILVIFKLFVFKRVI